MEPLKKLVSVSFTAVLVLGIISLFLPSEVHIERSMLIHAPVWLAYEQVNNLRNWEKWSPWYKMDPHMKLVYKGPSSGSGAQYSWKSERPVLGDGTLVIANAKPNERIVTEMNFVQKGKGVATHTFQETPEGTLVTWTVNSDLGLNPVNKYMGLVWESVLAPDFERGLANLKYVTEDAAYKNMARQSYHHHE